MATPRRQDPEPAGVIALVLLLLLLPPDPRGVRFDR